jgi:hypothetical protein
MKVSEARHDSCTRTIEVNEWLDNWSLAKEEKRPNPREFGFEETSNPYAAVGRVNVGS